MGAATSNINAVPPCYGSVSDGGGSGINCNGTGGPAGNSHSSAHHAEADGSLRLPAFVSRKSRSVSTLSGASCVGFLGSTHFSSSAHNSSVHSTSNSSNNVPGITTSQSGSSKSAKLSTLRKKMSRFRRKSNITTDYGKQMREFISAWSYRELLSLRQEYEALSTLKDLSIQAGNTRAAARSAKTDLSSIFESQLCADTQLIYQGSLFPVHRAILCSRCAVFRSLFASYPCIDFATPIPVEIRTPGIDVTMFSCLLKYLYTGQISMEEARLDNWETLSQLCEEFGTPNILEQDLKRLLDSASYSDCVLIFSSVFTDNGSTGRRNIVSGIPPSMSSSPSQMSRNRPTLNRMREVRCHRTILAARSKFFHNLILRRDSSESTMRVVLDENIIPRKFALILLNAFYTDKLDMNLLVRAEPQYSANASRHSTLAVGGSIGPHNSNPKRESYPSANGSSCSGLNPGNACTSTCVFSSSFKYLLREVTELYQIGQFLEFPSLSHACEDFLVEHLSVETLVPLLRWSGQPHGSAWVHRQALHFLHEEFLHVAHSPILYDLNKYELVTALRSPFLQAPESEILSAVIRWGEHELLRLMDERVPNIISHVTASNQPKKSAHSKRIKEIDNTELAELLNDVLPFVRLQHVLPAGQSEMVQAAIRRELIRSPPTLYLVQASPADFVHCWIRGAAPPSASPQSAGITNGSRSWRGAPGLNQSNIMGGYHPCRGQSYLSVVNHAPPPPVQFIPPRLFMPFYEEVKALLNEQFRTCKTPPESCGFFSSRPPARQPLDLLAGSAALSVGQNASGSSNGAGVSGIQISPDAVAATSPLTIHVLETVRKRAREMEQQLVVQRAFLMPCADRPAVLRQLQLRAIREVGLPDNALDITFSHAERQHGLVATAAAAAAALNNDDIPMVHSGQQNPSHGAAVYGPISRQTSAVSHGMPVDFGSPGHPYSSHHPPHMITRYTDQGRYSPAAMVTLPPLMTASWSGGIAGGGNFPPDVTLPHAAARQASGVKLVRNKRDQTTSSDEYEDTACIL